MFLGLHTDWKVFPLKKKVENKTLLASTLKKKEETCPIFSTCKIVCMRNCVMWHFQYSSEYLKYFLTSVEDTRKRMDNSNKIESQSETAEYVVKPKFIQNVKTMSCLSRPCQQYVSTAYFVNMFCQHDLSTDFVNIICQHVLST